MAIVSGIRHIEIERIDIIDESGPDEAGTQLRMAIRQAPRTDHQPLRRRPTASARGAAPSGVSAAAGSDPYALDEIGYWETTHHGRDN